MFDAGFQEFFLVFVVALIVLGPKRLPRFAHAVGMWLGRARGAVSRLQREINREMMIEATAEAVSARRSADKEKDSADASSGDG